MMAGGPVHGLPDEINHTSHILYLNLPFIYRGKRESMKERFRCKLDEQWECRTLYAMESNGRGVYMKHP